MTMTVPWQRQIEESIDAVLPEVVRLRHRVHRHPELAMQETATAALVREVLAGLGLEPRSPLLGTDVIAMIEGAGPGPNVTLRADMDALPLQECTGVAYASECPGVMHACGHDGHTAMLLGAAMVLSRLRSRFRGSVRLVFQPGEEVVAAGRDLVAAGALREPSPVAAVALHGWPGGPLGTISSRPGPIMAAAEFFRVVIHGRGGHGSRPEGCVDPVLVAARVIDGLQAVVAREISPLAAAVVSVCRVSAGTNSNIIPDRAELEGTTRSLDRAVQERLPVLMERLVKGICDSLGASYEFHYRSAYIPTVNDAAVVARGRAVAMALGGTDAWRDLAEPVMGGEDFAFYLRECPGAMFFLGLGEDHAALHQAGFDFPDEALRHGIAFLVGSALATLADRP